MCMRSVGVCKCTFASSGHIFISKHNLAKMREKQKYRSGRKRKRFRTIFYIVSCNLPAFGEKNCKRQQSSEKCFGNELSCDYMILCVFIERPSFNTETIKIRYWQ